MSEEDPNLTLYRSNVTALHAFTVCSSNPTIQSDRKNFRKCMELYINSYNDFQKLYKAPTVALP